MINKKFIFTKELKILFDLLLKNGDELMLVGGCVRNFLINKEINDYDLATKYKPDELIKIFEDNNINYYTIGINFGTIVALINNIKFEITTLRKDIKTDGRHVIVEFTNSYKEDAKRRDFTYNALYMDYNCNIYDYFDGVNDLKNGVIKFIGDAENRILEDNLRILRFFRFYSQYSYLFDYKSFSACIKHKNNLLKLSRERITEEFNKILDGNYPLKVLKIMQSYGILKFIINFNNKINFDNLEIFCSIKNFINYKFENVSIFVLCLIKSVNELEMNLLFSNKQIKYINTMLNNNPNKMTEFEIKKLLFLLNDKSVVSEIIILYYCNNYVEINKINYYLDYIKNTDIPNFNLKGQDLVNHGFTDNKNFSKIIKFANNIFINSGFSLDKESVLKELAKIY